MQLNYDTQSYLTLLLIFLVHFIQTFVSKSTIYPSGHTSHSLIYSGLTSAYTAGNDEYV